MTARVTSTIDDEAQGIAYLRATFTVIEVQARSTTRVGPSLGTGTTLSAIVRDPAQQAVLRAVNPSFELPVTLGWYAENVYEVLRVNGQLGAAAMTSATTGSSGSAADTATLQTLGLVGAIALISLMLLWLLRRLSARA